jgi:diguanylate cyclase (GGDEF)-like protein
MSELKILIVDDRTENLVTLEAILSTPGLDIIRATTGNDALGLMLRHNFAVVLLDVQMPEMDGFEVAELMRKSEKTKYIPIIFISAFSKDEGHIFKGYETGAVDYLFKPLDPVALRGKISIFLELSRQKQELEASRAQIEKQNKKLTEMSVRDGLTGLYNHRHFQELLQREYALAKRNRSDISCFMLDLDYFKDVNDTYGHSFGDFVLKNFSTLLRKIIRKTDILARYGGEEFVLLLPNTSLDGALTLAEKFRQKAEQFLYQQNAFSKRVTASIGVSSFFSHHPPSASHLVDYADNALYRAKAGGRNQVRFYNEEEMVKANDSEDVEITSLPGLKGRLNQILESSRESILRSMQSLLQGPSLISPVPEPNSAPHTDDDDNKNRSGGNKFRSFQTNQRKLEIFDLMGDRLRLPHTLTQTFKRASILHDLFKAFLGDRTAYKPSPLDKNESRNIENYPFMMEDLTRLFDIFSDERIILRYHHENFDGTGYPEGLKGAEVPLGARLFSLVDAFVAMTSNRNYKPVLEPEEAITELQEEAGKQFDPMLVKHLLALIEEKNILESSRKSPQKPES